MADTGIEWTDVTWNPVRGCSRTCAAGTSQSGCGDGTGGGCYAEQQAGRIVRMGKGKPTPYDGLVRETATGWRWTGKTAFDAKKLADPLKWKKPRRIFVDSMSDLFHDGFTNEQIAAVFGVMAACPQHTFQCLTKRAKRMREWFEWVSKTGAATATADPGNPWWSALTCIREAAQLFGHVPGAGEATWPLRNVQIGTSVENRAALERLDDLRACPAALRFISAEPLLEDLGKVDLSGIGWLIAGCESGPGARPCEVDWLRALRDQCAEAGVAYFLKQAREHIQPGISDERCQVVTAAKRVVETGPGSKRKAGGIIGAPYLDGVQHLAFPEVLRG